MELDTPHPIDVKRAQVTGRHLFAANDPKAEPHTDPKIQASDRRALELQIQSQVRTEWRHQP